MSPLTSVNNVYSLAATSDQIPAWAIVAIAAVLLLALVLIIVAARKSRTSKGADLRETLVEAKEEAAAQIEASNGGKHAR